MMRLWSGARPGVWYVANSLSMVVALSSLLVMKLSPSLNAGILEELPRTILANFQHLALFSLREHYDCV